MYKVNHFEIPYDDRKRAAGFYREVFGWEIKDSGVPGVEYDMAYTTPVDEKFMPKEVGVINGGMMKRTTKDEGPVIVITVDDIDETIKMATERGSEVVWPKNKVGDMGWYTRIKDSEGNIIGVWENLKKEM